MNMSLKRLLPLAALAGIAVALPTKDGLVARQTSGSYIHPGASASVCVTAASNADGALVTLQACSADNLGQVWENTLGGLRAFGTKCLDVPSGNTTNGQKLQIWTCDANAANPNQEWFVTGDARIAWTNHGECLDLTDGSLAPGNQPQLWQCTNGNTNQIWNFEAAGPTSTISSSSAGPTTTPLPTGVPIHPGASSSVCLNAAADADGALVTVSACATDSPGQTWDYANGTLRAFGRCLDVPSGNTTNGQKLQIWTCDANNANPNQQWFITADARIAWTNHGECLDLTDGSLASGNQVQLWTCVNGNTDQVWNSVGLVTRSLAKRQDITTITTIAAPTSVATTTEPATTSGPLPTGVWIHPGASSDWCLNALTNVNSALVTVSKCKTDYAGQTWEYVDGTLRAFGQCLDVTNGSTANGAIVQLWNCVPGNTNQQFFITGDNRIAWTDHGECLDLTNGSLDENNLIQMWQCTDNDANQVWNSPGLVTRDLARRQLSPTTTSTPLESTPASTPPQTTTGPLPTGVYIHPGASSSVCLNAVSAVDGALVTVSECITDFGGQTWEYVDGTLRALGKCLDVPSGNTANGQKLQLWTCVPGNTNQQFFVTGDARIAWTNQGECLDLTDGSLANGNQVQLWQCTDNNSNQVWNSVGLV